MPTLHIHSPAKINLSLRVVGRRADGYHLLRMVMAPLAFGDDLAVTTQPAAQPLVGTYVHNGIALDTTDTSVPLDDRHLCIRAALALRTAAARTDAVHIHLTKRIPVGGGLGGGSSNAGAVLRALNFLWELNWPAERLAQIGVTLGADVPFFCYDGPAWVRGIGEQISPMPALPPLWVLLVNPNIHVPTPEIFRALGLTPQLTLTNDVPDGTQPPVLRTPDDVSAHLHNDLEPATFERYPEVAQVKTQIQAHGGHALMSGSGATVFGIFPTQATRDTAASSLATTGWWTCKTQIVGMMS